MQGRCKKTRPRGINQLNAAHGLKQKAHKETQMYIAHVWLRVKHEM